MRLAAYAGVRQASVALATGVFLKALHQRANFYSACVYLSQSSANLMILTNVCLLAVGFLLFWLQRLLYGPLRPIETEQLYEKAWFAITETCLAMTIFRGELGAWFLVMFVCLLVGKVWGWISEGRVEFLEQQPPANPRLFHTRLSISLLLSVMFNAFLLRYCITTVLEQARPDMMVMFGFEFAILTIFVQLDRGQMKAKVEERRREIRVERAEAIRRAAQAGESSPPTNLPDENDIDEMELDVPGWEEKGRWVFYLDLLTDFLKLTVYLTFFAILFTFYGLPIHILRDVVVTIRSFGRRIMDFMRYRNATRDMNERYPDATAEEVTREEVCIICREEMTPWQQPADGAGQPRARVSERLRPKKLPCGHILHFACLRSWLERQQNCPTCRRPVLAPARPGGQADTPGQAPNIPGANQQPGGAGDGRPRARVYQFGPFRVGFGAGRGDLFQNLHQQIHQGNAPLPPLNNQHPNARQIGFGFGFGRPPPPPTQSVRTPTHIATDIHMQLDMMEEHILREISSLRVAADHLHLVRLLQAELHRLRTLTGNTSNSAQSPFSTAPVPPTPTTSTSTRHQQFEPRATAMESDDSRLPEGLSLPPGWTLTPLHSASGISPSSLSMPVPQSSQPAPSPETNAGAQSTPAQEAQSGHERSDGAGTFTESVPQDLPNWQSNATPASVSQNDVAPSNDWTDVAAETQSEKAGPTSTVEGSGIDGEQTSSSPSKGKARVPTVEDAVDDGV
ncbi:conserved hypothetical protein [Aspergillus terreus NIH2624]|uniref:RING-type E3 ubiquitin transferase n=1 Tax=Aspergillus terreus (strain NIH 2624 / FGSC A1156) TaxID=341663 RepID=Q0D1S4_ASPTN|nr:uncharacterized protein ATEG_00110 [Aspergillus terreus NIH2624]EAU38756.1 conserved hypothetical protein [Aspergillus terreus NIH2624]